MSTILSRTKNVLRRSQIGALGLGIGVVIWLSGFQLVWSQTATLQVTVSGQDYAQMVEASRPLVWQALAERFAQSSDPVERVTIEVMGQRDSAQLPLLLVTMTREMWQQQPTPQQMEQFAQFYTSAVALLTPTTPTPESATAQIPSRSNTDGAGLLVQSQPSPGEKLVPVTQILSFQFRQPLDPDLEEVEMSISPPTELGFDIQADTLLVQPLQPLAYSTSYQISLRALGDQRFPEPITLDFRTEPQYTYRRDVEPLLRASCVGCHQSAGRQRRQLLDSYQAVMQYVTPKDPGSILVDPRWTHRHARPRRLPQPQPGEEPPEPTDLENLPELKSTEVTPESLMEQVTPLDELREQPFSILRNEINASPELAYVRRNGTSEGKLGVWTPEEVAIVTTWIVQDGAPEDLDSLVMD